MAFGFDQSSGSSAENMDAADNAAKQGMVNQNNAGAFAQQYAGYNNQSKLMGQQNAFTGGQNAADRGLQQYLGDQGNQTQRYGIDQSAATQRQGNQLQYQASILPANLKQQRFNTVLPMFQQAFGALGGSAFGVGGGNKAYGGAGQVGTQPAISTAPVYSQSQIQQQVNAARAGNDRKTAGDINQMQGKLAGQGFGSNSPLAAALSQNYQGQNLAANADSERQTRMTAAQQNSGQVLNEQTAAENQFANRQQEDIARNKNYRDSINNWLGAFGSLAQ